MKIQKSKKIKRFVAFLLSCVMTATAIPAFELCSFAEESSELKIEQPVLLADEKGITREEWIHDLVTIFDMSVDDESTIQKYFTDTADSKYSKDIDLAANYGVFDIYDTKFNPKEFVTREFAAHTANYCIGYFDDGTSVSLKDKNKIYYEYDSIVSVQKNWFALSDGNFNPNSYMTDTEAKKILDDAKESLNGIKIDENAKNTVTYADSVIQIEDTAKATYYDGTVIISDTKAILTAGDVFVVNINDSARLFKAEKVTKGLNNKLIINTTETKVDDSLKEIDIQGVGTVDYENIEYYNTPQDKSLQVTRNNTNNLPNSVEYLASKSNDFVPVNISTVKNSSAMVNQATMTGESEPVCKKDGDSVYAGTTVEAGKLILEVRALSDSSRLQNIIQMIDESENLKAGIQSSAERLADSIVPYSFLGFGAVWLLSGNLNKALSVLMVDFSCAIRLSTPISVISAMREAAENGATVKGGKYLEAFANADTIVFDKTGTLTNANPKVTDVVSFGDFSKEYVLKTSACIEEHFPHSVASAVVRKAEEENLMHDEEHAEVEYLVAHGIVTSYSGKRAVIGSAHFVFEDENVFVSEEDQRIIDEKSCGKSSIFLAIGGQLAGMLVIDDPIRDDTVEIISELRKTGIKRICMLTGDNEASAEKVAEAAGLDMYMSQVLPEHKSEYVEALKSNGHTVIMVGDGINDSPALAAADVSVAMSDGSDIAREVADIALCNDRLSELVTLRVLSQRLIKRIRSNYHFIVGFNAALIALGIAGIIPAATSALLHNGSTMLISAKSMQKLL